MIVPQDNISILTSAVLLVQVLARLAAQLLSVLHALLLVTLLTQQEFVFLNVVMESSLETNVVILEIELQQAAETVKSKVDGLVQDNLQYVA